MSQLTIRPLTWRLSPELTSLTPQFFALKLPYSWKQSFSDLHNAKKEKWEQRKLPCDGLHRALTALVGDLLVVERNAWILDKSKASEFWLISEHEIDLDSIRLIVSNWAQVMWEDSASPAQLNKLLSYVDDEKLGWQIIRPDLAAWECDPNGTANPKLPSAFRLLPHYIAGELSRSDAKLKIGNHDRELRRCPTDRGAELMTWPPENLVMSEGSNPVPYCLVLHFTVQTLPFQAYPIVNCEVKVRRWKKPKPKFPGGNFGAYLHNALPWLPNLNHTRSFQKAPLRWAKEDGKYQAVWSGDSHLVRLMNRLAPHHQFPDGSTVFGTAFNAGANPFASIVHSPQMGSHPVGTGVFPRDLRSIGEQLEAMLKPLQLEWTPQPRRFKSPVNRSEAEKNLPKNLFAMSILSKGELRPNAAQIQASRREHMPLQNGGNLHLELFYQSGAVREAFEYALRGFFGIGSGETSRIALDNGGTLHYQARLLGAIGDKLEEPRSRVFYNQRCLEIKKSVCSDDGSLPLEPTLSFVELGTRESFTSQGRDIGDPKKALRSGFAACGRLTQFINTPAEEPPTDKLWSVADGALLDAMRQLGVGPQLPRWPKTDLPADLNIVGLWICKNIKSSTKSSCGHLPIFLRMNTRNGRIEVKARGFACWLPYGEAQLALAEINADKKQIQPTFDKNEIADWIGEVMRREVSGDTVVFADAQNARSFWSWLQNPLIATNSISFVPGTKREPLSSNAAWSGLRLIRVRDHKAGEAPQYFAPDSAAEQEDGANAATWTTGLCAFDDAPSKNEMGERQTRVFGSIADKPPQFTTNKRSSRWGKKAGDNAFNPRLLEITTAVLQPDDSPELWAAFTHRLRDGSVHYNSETALPWPLHLLKKIEEYVLPV